MGTAERLRQVAAAAVAVILLAGCSSVRLYSETRDKQGEAAKKAWGDVDLKSIITTERTNLNKLLDTEKDVQAKYAAAIRDQALIYMLSSTTEEGLVNPVKEKLDSIVGDTAQYAVWSEEYTIGLTDFNTRTRLNKQTYLRAKQYPPSCENIDTKAKQDAALKRFEESINQQKIDSQRKEKSIKEIKAIFNDSVALCAEQKQLTSKLDQIGGELGAARQTLAQDKQSLAVKQQEANEFKTIYEEALGAYTKALSETESPAGNTAAQTLKSNLDALLSKAKNNPYIARLLTEERLSALDGFLKAITEAEPDKPLPKDSPEVAKAIALFSNLEGQFKTAQANAKKPLVVPFILQKNYEELNLEALNRDIAAQEAIIRIDEEIFNVLSIQADQLLIAWTSLTATRPNNKPPISEKHKQDQLLELFSSASSEEKEVLYSASARYLDVLNRLDAKRYKLEYERIAAQHERALSYAEVNVKQWDSLIGGTVDQMASFGTSGIRTEHVTNILNTLGIFWIGAGVNK